jgi:hypothetical protein
MTTPGAFRSWPCFSAKFASLNDQQAQHREPIACDRPVRDREEGFWRGMRAGYWGRSSVTVNRVGADAEIVVKLRQCVP